MKASLTCLFATLCTFMSAANAKWDASSQAAPGAMSAYLNTTSLENIIQTFTPLVAYFSLNNRTFDVNITESSYLYSFKLDKIHII